MKKWLDCVCAAGGLLLLGLGAFGIKTWDSLVPAYLCVGVGCGLFGQGVGGLIRRRALKGDPELARRLEVEQKDERNVALSDRAKARAYDAMVFAFGALMLAFALMGVDLAAVLMLVFTYLLVVGIGVYYRLKLEKEM